MTTKSTTNPATGSVPVIKTPVDPARRDDVLFRVRREPGEEMSSWWMIGAFVGVSVVVVGLLNLVPGTI